jgi:hypothetical protein
MMESPNLLAAASLMFPIPGWMIALPLMLIVVAASGEPGLGLRVIEAMLCAHGLLAPSYV